MLGINGQAKSGNTYDAIETIGAVKDYIANGVTVIWLPHGSKNPGTQKDWQNRNIVQLDQVEQLFSHPRNVGVLLGEKSANLVDVDLDCLEAIDWAPEFLPPTPWKSGRASKPGSHYFYQTVGAVGRIELRDPLTGKMIVELRTGYNGVGRSVAQQTVLPPSLNPAGEHVFWETPSNGASIQVDASALIKAVHSIGIATLIDRYFEGDHDKVDILNVDPRVRAQIARWLFVVNGQPAPGPGPSGPQPGDPPDGLLLGQELLIALAALRRLDPGPLPVDVSDGPTKHGVIRALHRKSGGSRLGYVVARFWRERAGGTDAVDWDRFDKFWTSISARDEGQTFGSLMAWAKAVDPSWQGAVEEVSDLDEFERLSALGQRYSVDVAGIIEQQKAAFFAEPLELPDALSPVEPFSYDLLPDVFRAFVQDVAERMQCPPDFVAAPLVASLGSVIGRQLTIRPKREDDWTVISNMWAMVVARSGQMKSPAAEEAMAFLQRLSAKAGETYDNQMNAHKKVVKEIKAKNKAVEEEKRKRRRKNFNAEFSDLAEQDEPDEPVLRTYMTNNVTVEMLIELFRQNPIGVLFYNDELASLLSLLDQEEREPDRGVYLTAHNGSARVRVDRIGRGKNLTAEGACLSIVGTTQPERIHRFFRNAVKATGRADGMAQRFSMLVWPDSLPKREVTDRKPDKQARYAVQDVFNRLAKIDMSGMGAAPDVNRHTFEPEGLPYLRFDEEAYKEFIVWLVEQMRRIDTGDLHHAIVGHLSKYSKLVPSLALIFHLAENRKGPVGLDALRRALAWAKYLESHAHRAYGSAIDSAVDVARAILARVRSKHLGRSFTARDVYHPRWSRLSDPDEVRAGLNLLVEYDWLTVGSTQTPGKPKVVYSVTEAAARKLGLTA
jgi:hypothetical protein